jgi:hypothetical protein
MRRKNFSWRHNFAPKGPDLGGKAGEKPPVSPEKLWNIINLERAPIFWPQVQPSAGFFAAGPGPPTIFIPK